MRILASLFILAMVFDQSFSQPFLPFDISIVFISVLRVAGVAFLKAVPEGTYDAVIVDSSDPIGNHVFKRNMEFYVGCFLR